MKKIFLLLLTLSLTTINSQRPAGGGPEQGPKPITITGKVIDQETNQPLEYATLVVQSVSDPNKITGGITDVNGIFSVDTSPGNYNLSIEFIGYKSFKSNNRNLTEDIDLGTI